MGISGTNGRCVVMCGAGDAGGDGGRRRHRPLVRPLGTERRGQRTSGARLVAGGAGRVAWGHGASTDIRLVGDGFLLIYNLNIFSRPTEFVVCQKFLQ